MNAYSIPSFFNTLRDAPGVAIDKERLDFHLQHNDYFGVQATILGFIEERLLECETVTDSAESSHELALLRQLRAEAVYLHKNRYSITQYIPAKKL